MKKITFCKIKCVVLGFVSIFLLNINIISQSWLSIGTGVDGQVNALTVYNNELIVAGAFNIAGNQLVNRIAKWNGTNWEQLGIGMNDDVYALVVYNNTLVAAGKFTNAGGVSCNKVAVWNGSSWSSTGGIFNGNVYALAVQGTSLIAGGNFTTINGLTALRVAKWSNTWQTIGSGFNGDVNALAMFNSSLYAGGDFTISDGIPAKRISRFNGSSWTNVGVGLDDGAVYCFTVYNNSLYVGGTFSTIGGIVTNRIARWNGSGWSNVGFGFSNGVYSLHSLGSNLYAGGIFDFADFLPASKIAVNNGTGWAALGTGIGGNNTIVKAINSYSGDVVVGGLFAVAGGQPANFIALWRPLTGITPVSSNIPGEYSLEQNYPNPFNPQTRIHFAVPSAGMVTVSVYDSKGALVKTLISQIVQSGEYEYSFDAGSLTSGVYFYKLSSNGFTETRKMILVK